MMAASWGQEGESLPTPAASGSSPEINIVLTDTTEGKNTNDMFYLKSLLAFSLE